ncbi:uncharacterized protein V6R79_025312 [Siganus canaliculatus]
MRLGGGLIPSARRYACAVPVAWCVIRIRICGVDLAWDMTFNGGLMDIVHNEGRGYSSPRLSAIETSCRSLHGKIMQFLLTTDSSLLHISSGRYKITVRCI